MSSSDDEEMDLFGDFVRQETRTPVPEAFVEEVLEETSIITDASRFPSLNSDSRIIKFPSSAISVDFFGEASTAANRIQCRPAEDGSGAIESNTRLVEWEDGSWTLIVGSEHFRIIERSEDVSLFDKQAGDYHVSVGSVGKQFNVIPGSLDSRTHQHVVQQSAVQRKLTESRKVALAHGFASTHSATVNTIAVHPNSPEKQRVGGPSQKLTADFLEAGLSKRDRAGRGASVRDLKASYKRPRRREEEEEDVEAPSEYEEEESEGESIAESEEGSESSSDDSSDSGTSSSSLSDDSSSSSSSE
jgi:hypothetical protein